MAFAVRQVSGDCTTGAGGGPGTAAVQKRTPQACKIRE